jgi:N-acetylglucosamine kinase-like BadF-type ATPase
MVALGLGTAEDLVIRLNEDPVRDYASLFPVVLASAEAGDPVAVKVLQSAGRELANLAEILVQRLFRASEEVSVATHGGVFASSKEVTQSFREELRSLCPRVNYVSREIDPALGALEKARRDFGIWHRS